MWDITYQKTERREQAGPSLQKRNFEGGMDFIYTVDLESNIRIPLCATHGYEDEMVMDDDATEVPHPYDSELNNDAIEEDPKEIQLIVKNKTSFSVERESVTGMSKTEEKLKQIKPIVKKKCLFQWNANRSLALRRTRFT